VGFARGCGISQAGLRPESGSENQNIFFSLFFNASLRDTTKGLKSMSFSPNARLTKV
jgi:hypothetical protein